MADLNVTGLGITTAVGQGKTKVRKALMTGDHAFRIMTKPGRQTSMSQFLGAEIDDLTVPPLCDAKLMRGVSWPIKVMLTTLAEAWDDANLGDVDPKRIGLIIGGTNFQQRELTLLQERHRGKPEFLKPAYGLQFMDTDAVGACTQQFPIRGMSYTAGAASASGQIAVILAAEAVRSGSVDVCIAVGAPMDLSHWECQGFRGLGAMGSDRFAAEPSLASRPFDAARDGFIYGEACAVIVVEAASLRPLQKRYARILGWAVNYDGNRNPNSTVEGEVRAIRDSLQAAGLAAAEIEYVNTHGSGSDLGDHNEVLALRQSGLERAYLNATKSLLGHGLSAAGAVEIAATALQFEGGFLHICRNLENPIAAGLRWVTQDTVSNRVETAISLSFGFGGINSAICLHNATH